MKNLPCTVRGEELESGSTRYWIIEYLCKVNALLWNVRGRVLGVECARYLCERCLCGGLTCRVTFEVKGSMLGV